MPASSPDSCAPFGQTVAMLDTVARKGIASTAIEDQIRIKGKQDMQAKVVTTFFALFAEFERGLISNRTREGLAKARSSGKKLGRPKGSLGVSRPRRLTSTFQNSIRIHTPLDRHTCSQCIRKSSWVQCL